MSRSKVKGQGHRDKKCATFLWGRPLGPGRTPLLRPWENQRMLSSILAE